MEKNSNKNKKIPESLKMMSHYEKKRLKWKVLFAKEKVYFRGKNVFTMKTTYPNDYKMKCAFGKIAYFRIKQRYILLKPAKVVWFFPLKV